MTTYRTWLPEGLDTIVDSIEVEAVSAEEAAKARAIDEYTLENYGVDPFEFTVDVDVGDVPMRFVIVVHIPNPVATVKESP